MHAVEAPRRCEDWPNNVSVFISLAFIRFQLVHEVDASQQLEPRQVRGQVHQVRRASELALLGESGRRQRVVARAVGHAHFAHVQVLEVQRAPRRQHRHGTGEVDLRNEHHLPYVLESEGVHVGQREGVERRAVSDGFPKLTEDNFSLGPITLQ